MSTFSPNFNIEMPTPATPTNKLGAELLAFGMSVDAILKTFDYNGADPNLVLARVAALETWRISAQAKIAALEDVSKERAWCSRNTALAPVSNAAYTNLTTSALWGTRTLHGGVTWNDGFVVPRAGRYQVSFSCRVSDGGGLYVALSKVAAPTFSDLLTGQMVPMIQSLQAVTLTTEIDLAANDRVQVYGLTGSGVGSLNAQIGAFSIRRAG